MKKVKLSTCEVISIIFSLIAVGITAYITLAVYNDLRKNDTLGATPVVAPVNNNQNGDTDGKSGFGGEKYIWDNWDTK